MGRCEPVHEQIKSVLIARHPANSAHLVPAKRTPPFRSGRGWWPDACTQEKVRRRAYPGRRSSPGRQVARHVRSWPYAEGMREARKLDPRTKEAVHVWQVPLPRAARHQMQDERGRYAPWLVGGMGEALHRNQTQVCREERPTPCAEQRRESIEEGWMRDWTWAGGMRGAAAGASNVAGTSRPVPPPVPILPIQHRAPPTPGYPLTSDHEPRTKGDAVPPDPPPSRRQGRLVPSRDTA